MNRYLEIVIFCCLCLLLLPRSALAGHEVLYKTEVDPAVDTLPADLAIVQFDTRPLGEYWNISAHHNFAYALRHGHQYLWMTMREGEECVFEGVELSPVWCKVKAMLKAHKYLPKAKGKYTLNHPKIIMLREVDKY